MKHLVRFLRHNGAHLGANMTAKRGIDEPIFVRQRIVRKVLKRLLVMFVPKRRRMTQESRTELEQ